MPQLQSYWPSEQNVTACILTEAESLADSQLLAVHEPMRLDRIEFQSGKVTQVGEGALLDFLLEHNRPLPLIGASGVGKSHLVRWVHAQLKRREDHAKYHIIRIPKMLLCHVYLPPFWKVLTARSIRVFVKRLTELESN